MGQQTVSAALFALLTTLAVRADNFGNAYYDARGDQNRRDR